MSTSICVTGANSFIGSHIVCALLLQGYKVVAAVKDLSDKGATQHLLDLIEDTHNPDLELVEANLNDEQAYKSLFATVDIVVHTALDTSLSFSNERHVALHKESIQRVANAIKHSSSLKQFVFLSSIGTLIGCACHPNPHCHTKVKRIAEQEFRKACEGSFTQPEFACLHAAIASGPSFSTSTSSILKYLFERLQLSHENVGDIMLPFVDVRDVALAVTTVIQKQGLSDSHSVVADYLTLSELRSHLKSHLLLQPVNKKPLHISENHISNELDDILFAVELRSAITPDQNLKFQVTEARPNLFETLNWPYTPLSESVANTCEQLIPNLQSDTALKEAG
ncbi:MAG: NAD-dependent epimerase/dehydratase family protein [Alteromonadaceae bacterium]|nr:NAD-dependent epimerase/dehydratase family protein [Alteromonadaceae bacterium]